MRISNRVARVSFLILIAVAAPGGVLFADDMPPVRLNVGRSVVIDVGAPISRVSLTSADIADAMVTSNNQLLVNGKMPGTITMFVWERAGALRQYEIIVQRDLARLNEQMLKLFPGEAIEAQSNGKAVVLSGLVSSKDAADKAMNVAAGYVEKPGDVVNLLKMQETMASNQVLLRVRFAEVSRSALSELGVGLFTSPTGIKNTLVRTTTQQFNNAPGFEDLNWTKQNGDFGSDVASASGKFTFSDFLNLFLFSQKFDIGAVVKALSAKGLFQSLAEPNLVSESGKEATFLAGGEVPIPVAQGSGGNVAISVMYKEFGVRLSFTPTVIGNRVHLKVKPEVSSLDYSNGVVLQGFRIPGLSTRRTETELELMDGQTFAIAGLMNNTMNTTMSKIPGIGDIPILGLLFKSKQAQKNQTELVVMITPHILPRNSPGVTPNLPRITEPYLPTTPANRSMEMPPPAFGARPGMASAQPVVAPAPQPATDAAAAAATMRALTPSPRPAPYAPGTTELPATQTVGTVTATSATPAVGQTRQAAGKAATSAAAKNSRRQDERAQETARADRARQEEVDRRNARIEQERQAKLAKDEARRGVEQAKKDVEAARVAAIEAKKQAELDRIQQKAVDDAAAKARAAEAKYQELLKQKMQSRQH